MHKGGKLNYDLFGFSDKGGIVYYSYVQIPDTRTVAAEDVKGTIFTI